MRRLSFSSSIGVACNTSADEPKQRLKSPESVQVWIIGTDIAPLAAAVYLLEDTQIPAENIHLLRIHEGCDMEVQSSGDAENGYVLRTGELPFLHDHCVDNLLSRVSSPESPTKCSVEITRKSEKSERYFIKGVRLLKTKDLAGHPKRLALNNFHVNIKHRYQLAKLALASENTLEGKSINDVFAPSFFDSNIWKVWSTTFRLQPQHMAREFRQQLSKYGDKLGWFDLISTMDREQYTINESIVVPVTDFLRNKGVHFFDHSEATDLTISSKNPRVVCGIEVIKDGIEKSLPVNKSDVVLVSLGSMSLGTIIGTNKLSPSPLVNERVKFGNWSLWIKLSIQSRHYGEPLAFSANIDETKLESFTVTLHDPTFLDLYQRLTDDHAGSGRLVSLVDSSWMLSISLPQRDLFPDQPKEVDIIWGYGLHPERLGDYVRKPMLKCSGEDIMLELLQHLQFPIDKILPSANTIPIVRPLATASYAKQLSYDRPFVIQDTTRNLAFVGPFTQFPQNSTCSGVEYSIRSAQYAVQQMMGLEGKSSREKHGFISTICGLFH